MKQVNENNKPETAQASAAAAKPTGGEKKKMSLETLVKVAVLGALAAVIMLIEFPLPIAPPFYEMDLSEIVVLVGGFAMGPIAAIAIEAVKIALNLVITGSDTVGVGELANFLIGLALVLPPCLIYKHSPLKNTRKGAAAGMAVGIAACAAVGAVLNVYMLIPFYSTAYGLPVEQIVAMGASIFSSVDSVWMLVLCCVVPFNLIKGLIDCAVVFLCYKRLSPLLHRRFIK